ncbi:MAG TPA: hypothetical protein VFE46_13260 [Pirellulales bacterium]|jgi:hypothetical protein|nr:hypothetical protein [Pirellulales bacterium]
MNVTFPCPKCETAYSAEIAPGTTALTCTHCGQSLQIPAGAIDEHGGVHRCLACPSADLFVRKDFPQQLGVAIVTLGLLGSCVAWAYSMLYWTFAILFATALVDVILYVFVPNALMCYRCGAMYRGTADVDQHAAFNLETHERYRQQKIRWAQQQEAARRSQPAGNPAPGAGKSAEAHV